MNLAEWVFLIQSGFSCSRITCSKFCALNNAIPVCLEFTWQYPPSEFLLKKMRAVFFLFFFLSISPFTVGCYDCLYDYIIVQLKGLLENSNFFLSYQKLWLIFIVSLCWRRLSQSLLKCCISAYAQWQWCKYPTKLWLIALRGSTCRISALRTSTYC